MTHEGHIQSEHELKQFLKELLHHLADDDDLYFETETEAISVQLKGYAPILFDLVSPDCACLSTGGGTFLGVESPNFLEQFAEAVLPWFRATGTTIGMVPELNTVVLSKALPTLLLKHDVSRFLDEARTLSGVAKLFSDRIDHRLLSGGNDIPPIELWNATAHFDEEREDIVAIVSNRLTGIGYPRNKISHEKFKCEVSFSSDFPPLTVEQIGTNLLLSAPLAVHAKQSKSDRIEQVLLNNFSFFFSGGETLALSNESDLLLAMRHYPILLPFATEPFLDFAAQFINDIQSTSQSHLTKTSEEEPPQFLLEV